MCVLFKYFAKKNEFERCVYLSTISNASRWSRETTTFTTKVKEPISSPTFFSSNYTGNDSSRYYYLSFDCQFHHLSHYLHYHEHDNAYTIYERLQK